mmetsp:Transcript_16051/g.44974  ORF Transcript_16051/g.44974 Transcript_16051/m.44974 type:complete len:770 (-) Transcript_16051:1028-3337(-)
MMQSMRSSLKEDGGMDEEPRKYGGRHAAQHRSSTDVAGMTAATTTATTTTALKRYDHTARPTSHRRRRRSSTNRDSNGHSNAFAAAQRIQRSRLNQQRTEDELPNLNSIRNSAPTPNGEHSGKQPAATTMNSTDADSQRHDHRHHYYQPSHRYRSQKHPHQHQHQRRDAIDTEGDADEQEMPMRLPINQLPESDDPHQRDDDTPRITNSIRARKSRKSLNSTPANSSSLINNHSSHSHNDSRTGNIEQSESPRRSTDYAIVRNEANRNGNYEDRTASRRRRSTIRRQRRKEDRQQNGDEDANANAPGERNLQSGQGPNVDDADDNSNGDGNGHGHGSGRSSHDIDDPNDSGNEEDGDNESNGSDGSQSETPITGPLWKVRMLVGQVVNHEYMQLFIIFLIVLNAIFMGVATFDFVTEDPETDRAFDRIDQVFLVVFTVEIAAQLFYLGSTLFSDGWLIFDLLIVIISWSFEGLQIVRAFRVFRAFRLITRVKPLRDLIMAIGAVLPRMYAIGALLLLIFYIFSVLFTELFKDLPLEENYFNRLDASLFTCMEMMTLEWGGIARSVMDHKDWAWAPFVAFIALTGFIVFNLIVAVVCDAVAITEKTVRELDGYETDTTEARLEEAQERIDLLQSHINDMLRTQQAVQDMIEGMAGEMMHLEAERKRSEQRAVDLRIEFDRRLEYQRAMESQQQVEFERKLSSKRVEVGQIPRRPSENSLSGSLHSRRRMKSVSDDDESSGPRSPMIVRRRRSYRRSTALSRNDSTRQFSA